MIMLKKRSIKHEQFNPSSSFEGSDQTVLIADSGATKTEWCLVNNGRVLHRFTGHGISPIYQTEAEIAEEIELTVRPSLKDTHVGAVYFYGSGCIPGKVQSVKNALSGSLSVHRTEVFSDLIAAAHALCGCSPGIACILGTGSNSCEWDGKGIVKQIAPLGFILGDEGSGASMGRQLVSDVLKNQLTEELRNEFLTEYDLTQATVIEKVYNQPFPSRFLAGFSPFLFKHIQDNAVRRIVVKGLSDFFERNVMQYDYRKNKVNFVGSVAWYFADTLRQVAQTKNIEIGKIEQSPMRGLIEYYNTL